MSLDPALNCVHVIFFVTDGRNQVQPGGPLFGIHNSNDGKICTIKGGIPIVREGECLGAIGVSGGMPDEDWVNPL